MITSEYPLEDQDFLLDCDLVLLSGGDPKLGMDVFTERSIVEDLNELRLMGGVLVGVSAGAMLLSKFSWPLNETGECYDENGVIQTFKALEMVPMIFSAHDEENNWKDLGAALRNICTINIHRNPNRNLKGVGLPFGSAAMYSAKDSSLTQLAGKKKLVSIVYNDLSDTLRQSVLKK